VVQSRFERVATAARLELMKIEGNGIQPLKLRTIVDSWKNGSMRVNEEYQRGAAWKPIQQQRLIDSVFRGYPLPLFYFREKRTVDFRGTSSSNLEVVDGQQRIRALAEFLSDKWPTLKSTDSRLSLPPAVANEPCAWGDRLYSDLSDGLKARFDSTPLPSILITETGTEDEVRDLFIRLQAGTALTRQQVRDAWPGDLGPFVEKLAGRLKRRPTFEKLWDALDRRGIKSADDEVEAEDQYHDYRQTCAQLLLLFFERERSWLNVPSLTARNLDDLYHKNTQLDTKGPQAMKFQEILTRCREVVEHKVAKDKLVLKNELFSMFTLFQDLLSVQGAHLDPATMDSAANGFWRDLEDSEKWVYQGKTTAPGTIREHYSWFVNTRMKDLVVPWLHEKRLFDDDQKNQIWESAKGVGGVVYCPICNRPLSREDAEFDHKIPWIRGGKTEVANGRPVHKDCHARGIAATQLAK
jgi:hypothetical protein